MYLACAKALLLIYRLDILYCLACQIGKQVLNRLNSHEVSLHWSTFIRAMLVMTHFRVTAQPPSLPDAGHAPGHLACASRRACNGSRGGSTRYPRFSHIVSHY